MHKHLSPEVVAQKFAAVADCEYPRLAREFQERPRAREIHWFLQAVSMRPGGIEKFAAEFVERFRGEVGTPAFREISRRSHKELSARDAARVQSELPMRSSFSADRYCILEVLRDADFIEIDSGKTEFAQKARAEIAKLSFEKLTAELNKIAREELAPALCRICENPSLSISEAAPWFLPTLPDLLVQMLEEWEREQRERIAFTEVARMIFDVLDYAVSESEFVMIEGSARFGKTHSLKAWCEKRPGLARLVTVPCSNSDGDFFRAIARALGIECTLQTSIQGLRERIEFVLEHSRLTLVFDEAHFLWPQRFSKRTPPTRLDWIRTAIIDRGIPCAIAATPQSFGRSFRSFVEATGYTAEQFFGRRARTARLPESVSRKDVLAVAQKQFPDIAEDLLQLIAGAAEAADGFLKAVEHIAKLARFKAGGVAGGIRLQHVKEAIAEVAPGVVQAEHDTAKTLSRKNTPFEARVAVRQVRPTKANEDQNEEASIAML